jgi:autotransporter-associated beta strand protein
MQFITIFLVSGINAHAQLTWQLAGGNESWPAAKRSAIIAAMNAAIPVYNANGYFTGTIYANYNASVPTAQASYGNWIDFGGSISTRVALHELSHTQGVGTVSAWDAKLSAGKWTGSYAINRVKLYNGSTAVVNADGAHFWPYGLNYDDEANATAYARHVRMVSALRRDMNIVKDSDNDGLPDDWEMFNFRNLNQTATGDYDADGSNNLAEYQADTSSQSFTFNWTGGSGPWDVTSSRWTGGGTLWRNGGDDVAVFGGTAGTVTIGSGISTNAATFNTTGYQLSGGGLALSGWNPTFHTASGVTATVGSVISSSDGLIKTGAGTLVLSGASTFAGALEVNGGILAISPTGRLFTTGGSGILQIKSGATLSFEGAWGWEGTLRYQGVRETENIIDGGTLRHTGPTNAATSTGAGRLFTIGAAGATLESATAGAIFRIGYRADYGETLGSNGGSLTLTGVGDGDMSYIIPGSGGLIKSGTGLWSLKRANTYTGATSVTSGTLELLNAYNSSAFAISSGAVLELDTAGGTKDYAASSFSGAGTLRKTGANAASWGTAAATFAMASGGNIDVQAGTFSGGTSANETWTNNKSDLTVAAGATFRAGDANVRVDALNGAGTVSSESTVGITFGVDNGDGNFTGVLADGTAPGKITKTGTGTQTLSGPNAFTGSVNVDAGALRITRADALGAGAKTITMTNGTNGLCRLVLAGGPAGITLPATLSFTTSNQNIDFPSIINESGNNIIQGNFTLTSGGGATRIRVDAGSLALFGNFTPNQTGRVLQLDGAASGILSGRLLNGSGSNIPGLSKEGTGTWTLTGSMHNFTGATAVNAGKLVVNGALTTTSGITVANTATLAGTGSVAATTVQSGGRLAPGGDTPGTLSTGPLTLMSGSSALFRIGNSSDRVNVTGNLTVSGEIDLTNIGTRGGTHLLMTCTGTLNTAGMTLGDVPAGWNCKLDTSVPKQVSLVLSPATFNTWQLANFTDAEISNPAISGPSAVPARDGIPNLMKYALGLAARTPTTTGMTTRFSGGTLSLTYRRPSNRPDLVYSVEASASLASSPWTTNAVTHVRTVLGDPETWQASVPFSGSSRFLRLKIVK